MTEQTQAKYHHLIPQTYMSAWSNESGTLNVEFLNVPDRIVQRNKENIAGIKDFHSITVGMPVCTKEDASKIFSVLSDYCVKINGVEINDPILMNKNYYDFDNWIIYRKDGSLANKKALKHQIEKVKIKDIETNWSNKYENRWNSVVEEIQNRVLKTNKDSIPAFDKEFLIKFFIALNWRGFKSNEQFEKILELFTRGVLDQVSIPFKERELPSLKTAGDEIRHDLLLNLYRQFLNDTGTIYKSVELNLKHTGFHFLISDGPTFFDTSDSPSFVFKRTDGTLQGIMPITPRILLAQGRCVDTSDVYYISHIKDDAVRKYNNIIRENASSFIIHKI